MFLPYFCTPFKKMGIGDLVTQLVEHPDFDKWGGRLDRVSIRRKKK